MGVVINRLSHGHIYLLHEALSSVGKLQHIHTRKNYNGEMFDTNL